MHEIAIKLKADTTSNQLKHRHKKPQSPFDEWQINYICCFKNVVEVNQNSYITSPGQSDVTDYRLLGVIYSYRLLCVIYAYRWLRVLFISRAFNQYIHGIVSIGQYIWHAVVVMDILGAQPTLQQI